MNLYINTMDSLSAHDERYKTLIQLLKKGTVQACTYHNKSLEDSLEKYQEKCSLLEIQIMTKTKEIEIKTKEIQRFKFENYNNLSRNQKNSEWDKESKSFSSRSYTSSSPMKNINLLKNSSNNEVEKNLLKFIMFLEEKAIPAIKIYKEEYRKIRFKQNNQVNYKINIDKLRRELLEEDVKYQTKNDYYKKKSNVQNDLNNINHHGKPLLNNQITMAGHIKPKIKHSSSIKSKEDLMMSKKNRNDSSKNLNSNQARMSFYSDDSYNPIINGIPVMKEKPS
mmetsp:Transcript_27908/g.24687  ORF Transcript_27908/g.24687 Transcript_27908/m.24687 type:complete len:280 (+) Transcript_27908:244-1083(+)